MQPWSDIVTVAQRETDLCPLRGKTCWWAHDCGCEQTRGPWIQAGPGNNYTAQSTGGRQTHTQTTRFTLIQHTWRSQALTHKGLMRRHGRYKPLNSSFARRIRWIITTADPLVKEKIQSLQCHRFSLASRRVHTDREQHIYVYWCTLAIQSILHLTSGASTGGWHTIQRLHDESYTQVSLPKITCANASFSWTR